MPERAFSSHARRVPEKGCHSPGIAVAMDQFAKETLPISLEEEMRRSYLDYAMSVIVGRARS